MRLQSVDIKIQQVVHRSLSPFAMVLASTSTKLTATAEVFQLYSILKLPPPLPS